VKTFHRQRAVGLDISSGVVRVLVLEGRADKARITATGRAPIAAGADGVASAQAIHAALAAARADGEAVVAAIGGPEVVVRQLTLPPVPADRVLQALELQHKDFGLLPPSEAHLDAQILKRSDTECLVLAVSAPKPLVQSRLRLLEQAGVKLRNLDVEALALLNAVIHLSQFDPRELLVVLDLAKDRTVLSLLSQKGPVVVRYLDVGAAAIVESAGDTDSGPAADASRDALRRIAEAIRLSLAFYRSEYDRESLPRYLLSGCQHVRRLNRWLTEELRLDSPFEVMDPFRTVRTTAAPGRAEISEGSEFVQAFGLALRAL